MASTAPDANVKATSNTSRARVPPRADPPGSPSILAGVFTYPVGIAVHSLDSLYEFAWAPPKNAASAALLRHRWHLFMAPATRNHVDRSWLSTVRQTVLDTPIRPYHAGRERLHQIVRGGGGRGRSHRANHSPYGTLSAPGDHGPDRPTRSARARSSGIHGSGGRRRSDTAVLRRTGGR